LNVPAQSGLAAKIAFSAASSWGSASLRAVITASPRTRIGPNPFARTETANESTSGSVTDATSCETHRVVRQAPRFGERVMFAEPHDQSNPQSADSFRRWAVGGVYLTAFALLAVAATHWRSIDLALESRERQERQSEEFHRQLVASIAQLSQQAGMLTSADQSPVRFRLRFPNGEPVCDRRFFALLDRKSDESGEMTYFRQCEVDGGGSIEFGLCPPGEYRLTLQGESGMTLVKTMELFPGVAIDRTFVCPEGANIRLTDARGWIDLGAASHPDVLALLTVVPSQFATPEGTWEPSLSMPSKVICGVSPLRLESNSLADVTGWEEFVHPAELPEIRSELLTLPYRYFKVLSVCWLLRSTVPDRRGSRLVLIGCAHFRDPDAAAPQISDGDWLIDAPPPAFIANSTSQIELRLPLPQHVRNELGGRVDRASGRSSPEDKSAEMAARRDCSEERRTVPLLRTLQDHAMRSRRGGDDGLAIAALHWLQWSDVVWFDHLAPSSALFRSHVLRSISSLAGLENFRQVGAAVGAGGGDRRSGRRGVSTARPARQPLHALSAERLPAGGSRGGTFLV
jgi:hypothetical protein